MPPNDFSARYTRTITLTAPARYRFFVLTDFGARYYRAGVGRFTTVDPVTAVNKNLLEPQGWNRYCYAASNPLRYVDPDGRYNMDVHWWMTYALSVAAGYSESRAKRVADANGGVDIEHNPMTPRSVKELQDWHVPSVGRMIDVANILDWEGLDDVGLGQNLHVLQDSFSHAGFKTNHASAAHRPDDTWRDVNKAMLMADATYKYLVSHAGADNVALPLLFKRDSCCLVPPGRSGFGRLCGHPTSAC